MTKRSIQETASALPSAEMYVGLEKVQPFSTCTKKERREEKDREGKKKEM